MENGNNNTQQPVQAQTPAAPAQASPQPVTQPNPALSQVPTPTPAPLKKNLISGLVEKYKNSSKRMKLLLTVGIVFLALIILLSVAVVIKNMFGGKGTVAVPTPAPTTASSSPLPQVDISNPSRYATDSGVLKIEGNVDGLSKEMDSVDLRQSTLMEPSLDFNIKFQ